MDSAKVKQLLQAASFRDCSQQQRLEQLADLLSAIPVERNKNDRIGERDREVITKLYWEIARENPEEFRQSGILRAFLLICGERNRNGFAKIDQSVFEKR